MSRMRLPKNGEKKKSAWRIGVEPKDIFGVVVGRMGEGRRCSLL